MVRSLFQGFRVFGLGTGKKPTKVNSVEITRDTNDARNVRLSWKKQPNAIGYLVRFGTEKDKLYRSYQVYSDNQIIIRSLDKDRKYWFAVDAFGESGVTRGDVQ